MVLIGNRLNEAASVRHSIGNTLWGGKDGRVRARAIAVAAVAAFALAAPALARAGDVPAEPLQQAQATANQLPSTVRGSVGVGGLDVGGAADKISDTPPNPNLALGGFIAGTPGGPVFNAGGWVGEARRVGARWNCASWASSSRPFASWASQAGALALVDNAALDGAGDG